METADLIQENKLLKQQNALLESAHVSVQNQVAQLQYQLDWFKRQLFGQKSEKQIIEQPEQGNLFDRQTQPLPEAEKTTEIKTHKRRNKQRSADEVKNTGLRFDASVPTEIVEILPPELSGPDADLFKIVGWDEVSKLSMRPGSYVILLQRIAKVCRKSDESFLPTPHTPGRVLDGTSVDVSCLAGLMVDKACYHLPLYRQHQRMKDAGIRVCRSSLSNWVLKGIELLRPIYEAQRCSVLQSKILAMDEVPIKAGRKSPGKMQQTYFWPLYGDQDEVVFTWSKSRRHQHALEQLTTFKGTLITDGYEAYEKTVIALNRENHQVTHANCWVHTRRYFERTQEMEPQLARQALDFIARLYRLEAQWREQELSPDTVIEKRRAHSEPIVHSLFSWIDQHIQDPGLLPTNPLVKALHYARKRADSLKVFLANPLVPLDTNHLERALRVIPMGRKNFLFCWSELGAEQLGILQSLLVTCRLHEVNPYRYLVDVLQRISDHPASQINDLIPRNWKAKFGDQPMGSVLDDLDTQKIKTSPNAPYRIYCP